MNDLQNAFNHNIEALLANTKANQIAVAVSGGADSLALLLLCHEWSQGGLLRTYRHGEEVIKPTWPSSNFYPSIARVDTDVVKMTTSVDCHGAKAPRNDEKTYPQTSSTAKNNITLIALTVDHQLRKESLAEARYVAKICNERNITHHILAWHKEDSTSSMHDSARKARYDLLTKYCLENDIDCLLTAHHADDEIENFFIRLSKASGLVGLTSSEVNYYNNIRILRPLSNVYKRQLESFVLQHQLTPCEDPSNQDPKYQRSNIRKWIASMPIELDPDLFKARILQSLSHLKKSADDLKKLFVKELGERVIISRDGTATYDFNPHLNEIEALILSHLLTMVSGADNMPRAESIERILNKFSSNESCKVTLHGCMLQKQGSNITIYRCFGKAPPTPIALSTEIKWDNRWRCNLSDKDLTVSYLSMSDYIELKKDTNFIKQSNKLNKNILFTIPVVFDLEKVVAIPHIDYYNSGTFKDVFFVFEPNYTSRLIHFC
jgi:tRNA(Ile)-lysidine synthase